MVLGLGAFGWVSLGFRGEMASGSWGSTAESLKGLLLGFEGVGQELQGLKGLCGLPGLKELGAWWLILRSLERLGFWVLGA